MLKERISINEGWRFMRYNTEPDELVYDIRPEVSNRNDNVVADTRAADTSTALSSDSVLKKWILPTANDFITDPSKHHQRPAGNPGGDFPLVQPGFNDKGWEEVTLPHDWAARGPFYAGPRAEVGGGMGRLPIQGTAWYRRNLVIPDSDRGKSIYLEIDGAMSYAMIWLNGVLIGGWPYGFNSFRLELTPYLKFGGDNQLSIRLDNPNHAARWYPGGGIYRNVWLTKVAPVHVAHQGTFLHSGNVSEEYRRRSKNQQVSAYELYTAAFGSSADKVFASQDRHPYVAGEFVWTGWDYLGEPTPYYGARSSYSGIIDLAGFKKDRFYLYQSRWRPELPMVHILPHWNWPGRLGQVTPVHIFTSGDEAELFLNGRSLGKKKKGEFEYRLRWDDIIYEPGELKVIAYRNGKRWAEKTIKTTGKAAQLVISADRTIIDADGKDLSFITIQVMDAEGLTVPDAARSMTFTIEGPGEIVATDNGDPASMVSFASLEKQAYSGLVLAIVRSVKGKHGDMKITATSPGLGSASLRITSR